MKKVTVMYSKGDGFADLIIRIDGRKFSDDKTAFIADMPIENWFRPSNDLYFEWSGFVDEIEKAANISASNLIFEFHGEDADKKTFFECIEKNGFIDNYTQSKIDDTTSQNNDDKSIDVILEQVRADYDAKRYTAAFRGADIIVDKSIEAKFLLAQMYLSGNGVDIDKEKAVSFFEECEQAGNLASDSRLAQCYYYGWGTTINFEKAIVYAQKGISADIPYCYRAHYILGLCFLESPAYSLDEAIYHLKICVDKYNLGYYELGTAYKQNGEYTIAFNVFKTGTTYESQCYAQLAECYAEGKGVTQDRYKAFKEMEKGAQDDYKAKVGLAEYYITGFGTEINISKGIELLNEVSENYSDDPDMFCLNGLILSVEEKYEEATQYFEKAIECGDTEAKIHLGACYIETKNYEMAENVLLSAINDHPDNHEIYKYLGDCYFYMESPIKNNKIALNYYEKAAQMGSADAMYSLFKYYVELRDEEQARKYLTLAKDHGHFEARIICGQLAFKTGKIEEAVSLLEDAAKSGSATAQYYLGRCYWDEKYCKVDRNQAIYWLTNSAENGCEDACFYLFHLYTSDKDIMDKGMGVKYLIKGHELGDDRSTFYLGQTYLFEEVFYDEDKGIELLRQLVKKNNTNAILLLSKYFYKKYHLAITKLGVFDFYDETGADLYLKLIPGIQLIACPIVWVKNKARQVKREQDISPQDMSCIKEMVVLLKRLVEKPGDLSKNDIKMVKKLLNSIKDKYRS